jgi:ABC-type transporter Mla subunit MlaD
VEIDRREFDRLADQVERVAEILTKLNDRVEAAEAWQKTAEPAITNLIAANQQLQEILRKLLEPRPPKPKAGLN